MFVAGMDISWMQSPFLRHRCLLKSEFDIKLLKQAGAKKVTIDTSKGIDVSGSEPSEGSATPALAASPVIDQPPAAPIKPVKAAAPPKPIQTSMAEELGAATAARQRTESALTQSFAEWERGNLVIDTELQGALEETTASLTRNDQALLRILTEAKREPSLVTHAFATYTLITALCQQAKCADRDSQDLGLAAILHDFGWLKLPRNLLLKSRNFTEKEQLLTDKHVGIIDTLLANANNIAPRIKTWVHYHEQLTQLDQLDGRLSTGDKKLLSALQVVDQYDELCAGIMGKQGRTPSAALSFLYRNALTGSYSIEWVQKLIFMIGVYPLGSAVLLSNHEKGIVAEIHRDSPLHPVIEVRYNRLGQPLVQAVFRQLDKQGGDEEIRIVSAIDPLDSKQDPAGILRS